MIGAIGWAVIFGLVLAWQWIALLRPRDGWPTVSDMLDVVTAHPLGRWVLFAAWLWFGWHLFVRGWDFLLRDPPEKGEGKAGAETGSALVAPAGAGVDEALVHALLLLLLYLSLIALVLRAGRGSRLSGTASPAAVARPAPSRLLAYAFTTATCGYGLFLLGITVYGASLGAEPGFYAEAVAGGGFLTFGAGLPAFLLLGWIRQRRARR